MTKVTFLFLGLTSFFLQGYFFPDALFKFIPTVSEGLTRKTKGSGTSTGKVYLIRAVTMIIAGVILLLVLPGFLQAGVILILDIAREDLGMARVSVVGWLFGIIARGFIIQMRKAKERTEHQSDRDC